MMLSKEQIEQRRRSLGASEIAAVCGLSPWQSAHDVWMSKLGLVDEEEDYATRVGTLVEPIIKQLYCEDMQVEVSSPGTIVHPKHAWATATPDFKVEGASRGVEVKCVGWRSAFHWTTDEDGIPDYYRPQVEWQCACAGYEGVDVAALLGGTEFRIYRIKHDPEMAGMLLDIGGKFWRDHVLTGEPPTVDGTEGARRMIAKLYPRNTGPIISADAEVERLVASLRALDVLDKQRLELENKLKASIKDADGIQGDGWSVTYRANTKGVRSLRWKHQNVKAA